MHVLVEPSDYLLRNFGDMAMLQVAVSRLREFLPEVTIEILSDEPDSVQALCPVAAPLAAGGRHQWLSDDFLPKRVARRVPPWWPAQVRTYAPQLVERFWRYKLRRRPGELRALAQFTEAMARAEAVVVAGMGGITDTFPAYALGVLETLRLATRRGKYVAMVGQGFGPLSSPALVAAARAILPRVDFIALREELCSKPLLLSLGVSTGRIMTTGDDAVEMAHRERPPQLGAGLGVNMRAADYSGVGRDLVDAVRLALHEAAGKRQIDLLPVPISRVPGEADAETIRMLLAGYGRTDEAMPDDVGSVIRQIARCRVVVTGSYHAGVFALSMGVPTIGLARSEYYVGKFTGLAGMFGAGCQVVMLNESGFPDKLSATIGRLCDEAEALRPQLLTQADRQVALGRAAYARFCSAAEERRHRKRH